MASLWIHFSVGLVVVALIIFEESKVESRRRSSRGRWHKRLFPKFLRPIFPTVNSGFETSRFRKFLSERRCKKPETTCDVSSPYRTIDGTCNNKENPRWGSAGQPFPRLLKARYDKVTARFSTPRIRGRYGDVLPSVRKISQEIHTSDVGRGHLDNFSDMHWAWGQFLDHDITRTPINKEVENCCENFDSTKEYDEKMDPCFPIHITEDDRYFQNTSCMSFRRSQIASKEATCPDVSAQQMNAVTAYIDASHVYGDEDKLAELRTFSMGQLKTTENNMLPTQGNSTCQELREVNVDNTTDFFCFSSGDPRVNTHPGLSGLHVVFHRLHNVVAAELSVINPHWYDDTLFEESRKIMGAIMQVVTYREFLPGLLGTDTIDKHGLQHSGYYVYDSKRDASLMNEFATAAFRYGHSQISGTNIFGDLKIPVDKMLNRPFLLQKNNGEGLKLVLRGMITNPMQKVDRFLPSGLTDRLFEMFDKKFTGKDLVSLNIQRGRDHGIAPYNDYREYCGRRRIRQPRKKVSKRYTLGKLLAVYRHVDDIDLYTGGLSERRLKGSFVGPTFNCIIAKAFECLKYCDRFWYENTDSDIAFTPEQIHELSKMTLSSAMCQTLDITEIQKYAMKTVSDTNPTIPCMDLSTVDLSKWMTTSK